MSAQSAAAASAAASAAAPSAALSQGHLAEAGFGWRERLSLAFMRRMLASPEGRAHLLSQTAEAESSGEARIFDQALARVDDPELQRLIGRHRADELRHEQLFRDRLRATMTVVPAVPAELRLIDRLDQKLGSILERTITDDRGVLEAYCLLQALEERAVTQFPVMAAALEPVDPESARVFREVLEDEKRHLLYCVAVAKRYAASEAERLEVLSLMRAAETEAFAENQRANLAFALERGLVSGAAALPWRVLLLLLGLVQPLPRTRFAR